MLKKVFVRRQQAFLITISIDFCHFVCPGMRNENFEIMFG